MIIQRSRIVYASTDLLVAAFAAKGGYAALVIGPVRFRFAKRRTNRDRGAREHTKAVSGRIAALHSKAAGASEREPLVFVAECDTGAVATDLTESGEINYVLPHQLND